MHFEPDTTVPEAIQRREFLQKLSAAGAAAWMAGEPRLVQGKESASTKHPRPKADACILLWMAGGMAAPDTFDPKRYSAFKPGTKVADILSTFPAIDSVVDDVKLTEGL